MKDVNNEEGYACEGTGGVWDTSLSSQFFCEPRALKCKLKQLDNFYFLFCYTELDCFPCNYTEMSKA